MEKEHLNPLKLVEHAKRLARREHYERVFIVVDEDDLGHELPEAAQRCRDASGKRCSFHLIVSHVCFEVWLLAHRRTIPDAARDRPHLTTLVQSEGLVERDKPKCLSTAFPYEGWEQARGNISVLGGNEAGKHPATAVPVVLEALQAAKGRRP
ncbi:RloB family protein [Corynebacterium mastitidis]|uniref:RloB family protein n=1 Tax=Corynebacterium mastitidis TaxID=161890 RepID=UPI003CC7F6B4